MKTEPQVRIADGMVRIEMSRRDSEWLIEWLHDAGAHSIDTGFRDLENKIRIALDSLEASDVK